MIKTLTAALVAASLMVAPGFTAGANAAQPSGAKAATTTIKPVKVVKKHKVVKVKCHKHAKHVRHYNRHMTVKRHGKIVKAHRHSHVVAAKPRARAN
jgi:hypothetical protein